MSSLRLHWILQLPTKCLIGSLGVHEGGRQKSLPNSSALFRGKVGRDFCLPPSTGDKLEFKECIGLLLEYSFIDTKNGSSFSMHSVLHHWCFHTVEENKATMSWLALIIVASVVPSETVLHYSLIQRRLLPHCDHVYSMLQRYLQDAFKNREYPSLSSACYQLGYLYSDQGKMKEAEDERGRRYVPAGIGRIRKGFLINLKIELIYNLRVSY